MLRTDGLKKSAVTCLNSVKSKRGAKLGRFLDQAIILHNKCQECSTFEPTNHPILHIWHYYGPSPPSPTLVKCCLVWFRNDPAIIHWLLSLLLLLFFFGGWGRVSVCKCSCFYELYFVSWKYITERPFFLTVRGPCTTIHSYIVSFSYLVQLWRLKELVSNSVQVFGFSEVGLDQHYLLDFLSQEKILYGICEILKIDQIATKMFMVIFHNNKVCN